jgi:hypothetical protein
MRFVPVSVLLLACACGRPTNDMKADTAAVYEAFLGRGYANYPERVLLQDLAVPVHVEFVADWRDGAPRDEVSREFSAEVREALEDLVARGRTRQPLAPAVKAGHNDIRLPADSVQVILEMIQRQSLDRLPEKAAVVRLSAVGFSRDGTVAAVYEDLVCGSLCGGASVTLLRKHPAGWLPAEQVLSVLY